MVLNNYSSFFELFAGLSLAYTGFSYVRRELKQSVFKISEVPKEVKLTLDEIKASGKDLDVFSIKVKFFDAKIEMVKKEEKEHASFFMENFRVIYLVSFFYNITLIILGGLQQSYPKSDYNCFIEKLSVLVLLFYLYIFISTFYIDKFSSSRIISPIMTTIFYAISLIISAFTPYSIKMPLGVMIFFVLFTSIISYLFLFNRVYFHRKKYKKKYKKVHDEVLIQVKAIKDFLFDK